MRWYGKVKVALNQAVDDVPVWKVDSDDAFFWSFNVAASKDRNFCVVVVIVIGDCDDSTESTTSSTKKLDSVNKSSDELHR